MEKIILIALATITLSACSAPKAILLKSTETYTAEIEGKKLFSFSAPQGEWYFSPGGAQQLKRGFTNIAGKTSSPYYGYMINLDMNAVTDKHLKSLKRALTLLKTQNYKNYLKEDVDEYTPELLRVQNKNLLIGKVITIYGMHATFVQVKQHVGPALDSKGYGGQGITTYTTYITVPLVIDGNLHQFNTNITSSISDQLYKMKDEYNLIKKSIDPEVAINPDLLMKNVDKDIAELFGSLKFYGKVSQKYEDLKIKCYPVWGEQCTSN